MPSRSSIRYLLLGGASALLAPAGYAHAAEAPAAASEPRAADTTISEVVVTAEKRGESLQNVPVAVTAVSAKAAEALGITNTTDIPMVVPGLDFTLRVGSAQPHIRGIGSNTQATSEESSTAVYIDGVYKPQLQSVLFALSNIEQIEVLKGPQGTLFGRNSAGGVIQVITRTPSFSPVLDASVGYANYDQVTETLYASRGLTDSIAADVSLYYDNQASGWGANTATGSDVYRHRTFAARSKLLWKPDSDTQLILAGDYTKSYGEEGLASRGFPGSRFAASGAQDLYTGFYNVAESFQSRARTETWSLSAKLTHDFGWAQFVSITAEQKLRSQIDNDNDHTPRRPVAAPDPLAGGTDIVLNPETRAFSQEVQLLSPATSRYSWIVGAYYFDSYGGYTPFSVLSGSGLSRRFPYESVKSLAGFGQIKIPIIEGTNITLGGRYTTEDRHLVSFSIPAAAANTADRKATFVRPDWRVVLDTKLSPNVMAYVSYNTGFKSGQFNTISPGNPVTRPEVLKSYEAGLKTETPDHRLRLNLATFFYDFKDIQLTQIVQGGALTLNAAAAHEYGVEGDLEVVPIENLTLQGGFSYYHGRYVDFANAPISTPRPLPLGGNTVVSGKATGNVMIHLPEWVLTFGGQYNVFTGSSGKLSIGGLVNYNDGFYWDPDNRLKSGPRTIVNGSIRWTSQSQKWDVTFWGKNLLKQKYLVFASDTSPGGDLASPASPLTFGITIGMHM